MQVRHYCLVLDGLLDDTEDSLPAAPCVQAKFHVPCPAKSPTNTLRTLNAYRCLLELSEELPRPMTRKLLKRGKEISLPPASSPCPEADLFPSLCMRIAAVRIRRV